MPTAADADAEPRFDDVTGEALNVAALELQRRATQNDYVAAHAPSEDSPLRRVPAVDVAPGRHKYVLTQLAIGDEAALVVRAYAGCAYHANNFELLTRELARLGVDATGRGVGGGRCERDDAAKTIKVYGYSKTFGRTPGCNERACAMIQEAFTGYQATWSDDGY